MIEFHARHITKSFDNRLVLNLDLHFQGTGLHIILGPNGCGKSTLLKLLAGLSKPDTGEIMVQGNKHLPTLVPKADGLFNSSVRNNVAYGLKIRKVKGALRRARIDDSLMAVDLSHLGRANALTLSSGEKQRLCMAMAMAVQPDVILLDEPTSSLDPHNAQQLEDIILQMKQQEIMIILVTHNISQARRLADSVTFMSSDTLVSQQSAETFFSTFDKDGLDGYL